AGGNHDAALQYAAQALDVFGRPTREIEQRALADDLAVPIALSQEDGGRRPAVGDCLDVHGANISRRSSEINDNSAIYMATFLRSKQTKHTKNKTLKENPRR